MGLRPHIFSPNALSLKLTLHAPAVPVLGRKEAFTIRMLTSCLAEGHLNSLLQHIVYHWFLSTCIYI